MKKVFYILLLLLLIGCKSESNNSNNVFNKVSAGRFYLVPYETNLGPFYPAYIITDTETGVKYLLVKAGYGAGLTKLEE